MSHSLSDDIYLFPSMFLGMAFQKFVGAGVSKEVTFVPKDLKGVAIGLVRHLVSLTSMLLLSLLYQSRQQAPPIHQKMKGIQR